MIFLLLSDPDFPWLREYWRAGVRERLGEMTVVTRHNGPDIRGETEAASDWSEPHCPDL